MWKEKNDTDEDTNIVMGKVIGKGEICSNACTKHTRTINLKDIDAF
jgi:hypothetical protein